VTTEVFEQAPALTEIGAAVALSANATRELRRLGVLDAIAAVSTEPTELIYRNWWDGRRITAYPVRNDLQYRKRFGAPFYGIHRTDLQHILTGTLDGVEVHLGHRLTNLVDQGDTIGVEFANGRYAEADLVIGADGVRSVVRRFVTGTEDVLGDQRFPWHRAGGAVALPRQPPSPPVLDGSGRTPVALRDRRQSGCGELSRRCRRSGSLAP
jgi:salicylate hydroxylase